MSKVLACVLAFVLAACVVAPAKVEPEILSTFIVQKSLGEPAQPDGFLVRLNFVVFQDEVASSPQILKTFQTALAEWASYVPIECAIAVEPSVNTPFVGHINSVLGQPGIVKVHITDIQTVFHVGDDILGFWNGQDRVLAFSKSALDINPDRAKAICMHEIGHALGLHHIVNRRNPEAMSGWLVIEDQFNAESMVMFPYLGDANNHGKLSNLEIALARQHIHEFQMFDRQDCSEKWLDK